ncbi:catalase-like domain-containing protein [Ilyonectria robusta]|uniref:catalase-like domain-containing protein n=1 Tax=Ilyonectria robusta TaxID=1079257 RepID=UPI001E8DA8DB|nr:catalase-like domain-containing protein [Ilyonectria robusta]KAH8652862.1 catalase-like domain-containing protein [Ilyonectria robusta]
MMSDMSSQTILPERPIAAQSRGDHTMASTNAGRLDVPAPQADTKRVFTLSNGCPIRDPLLGEQVEKPGQNRYASQLMQDLNLIDTLSHVTRERIPERYVHAKGVGAFGEFELTTPDLKKYTDAKFLHQTGVNKKTRLFARFSTVAGERGYPDTVRDTKGAAFKLYTEEGNLDWAFLNPDIFFIRDPVKFPSLSHSTKRDPATNLPDPNMFWDYFNNHPEGYNALMRIFSDEGTPKSYSRMKISSVNTYTFTKKNPDTNTWTSTFVKLRLVPDPEPDQDKDYFSLDEAATMAGKDPDYLTRRLYDEINSNNKPTWNVYAQIIDPTKQGDGYYNIFDATKVVPDSQCTEVIKIGKITLNENPQNFFSQVEQAAFNPANVVPGWDISPDPVLTIRLFMYGDTQRYRLGVNNDQLPTNKPADNVKVWTPTRRDGAHNINNYGNARNYLRKDESQEPEHYNASYLNWEGRVVRFKSEVDDQDWQQCADHWKQLSNMQKNHFITNVASSLSTASVVVQGQTTEIFKKIWTVADSEHADMLVDMLKQALERLQKQNATHQHKPGVIAGGEEGGVINYIPPPVPNPATGSQEVYNSL